jgi:dipeptidyl aminopeptidase/acylaminoacyl peptidase
MRIRSLAIALLIICFVMSIPGYTSAAVPVETLASLPSLLQPRLSSDGSKMIALRPMSDTYHLFLLDLKSKKFSLLMAADPKKFLFNWCNWASQKRVVCSIRSATTMPRVDQKVIITNLVAVDIDGANMMQLVPKRKRSVTDSGANDVIGMPENVMAQLNDRIISYLPEDDQHVLISLAREKWARPTVYKLNIYNNRIKRVQKYQDSIRNWYSDQQGHVRIGVGRSHNKPVIKLRKAKDKKFHDLDLTRFDTEDVPAFRGFSRDGRYIYLATYNKQDRLGLYAFDTESETLGEPLATDETYDLSGPLIMTQQDGLIAATFTGDRTDYKWFNKKWEENYRIVSGALPGQHVIIESSDESGNTLVFSAYGEGHGPGLYLYDARTRSIVNFGRLYRNLDDSQVLAKQAISYQARDGLDVPAYLTLPNRDSKRWPTIILPHGGPIARESGDFDYWSQFLANQGYAVLQPNFRGSSGYGRVFMEAGYQQWGQKMQDDILDGLQWMIDEGITDPEKVCIVGGSYGGYAALVAAYQSPEKFKCAVSFAGVSDLRKLLINARRYIDSERMTSKIVGSMTRWKEVKNISPITNVDKIALPLLLVHGDEDDRVAVKQSRDLVAKLDTTKVDYEYVEQEGGDHHLSLESHRLEFFRLMQAFLSKYLK